MEDDSSHWKVSWIGKLYLTFVALESAFLIGTAVATLVFSASEIEDLKFIGILAIYVSVGFLYFAFDSILQENVFQFWSSVIIHGMITTYVVWHYIIDDLGSFFHKYSYGMLIGISVIQGLYLIMAPWVHTTFGWRLYKQAGIGASVVLQACYKTYSIFFSLLKLDLFMGLLVVVMGYFFLSEPPPELAINVTVLFLTFLWAAIGWRAMRSENTAVVYIFLVLGLIEPGYLAFKLWEIHTYPNRFPEDSFVRYAFTGGSALFIRVLLIVWTHWTKQNFGKGLRSKVFERQQPLAVAGSSNSGSQYQEISDHTKPLYSYPEDRY